MVVVFGFALNLCNLGSTTLFLRKTCADFEAILHRKTKIRKWVLLTLPDCALILARLQTLERGILPTHQTLEVNQRRKRDATLRHRTRPSCLHSSYHNDKKKKPTIGCVGGVRGSCRVGL